MKASEIIKEIVVLITTFVMLLVFQIILVSVNTITVEIKVVIFKQ